MKLNVKEWGEKFKAFFLAIEKKTRRLLAITLACIVVAAIVIAVILNNRPYEVLFTGLASDEATAIMAYLDENGIYDYRLENGNTILVPRSQETQLKAKLLMEGYPKSGFAYETYRAGVGTMSTAADREIAYIQDLQDRIAAVIRCMTGVKDANVTIAQGEDRRYVLDSGNMTTASAAVLVTMRDGGRMSAQMADAIRNLVSRAVSGLTIDNIAITDSQGNSYASYDTYAGTEDASMLKLRLEQEVNNTIRAQVLQILIPLYGADNVQVGVNSIVDVSRSVGESVKYTEPNWATDGSTKGEGIIGSQIYDQEIIRDGQGPVGGVVGTESNSDINTYVQNSTQLDGDETYVRSQGEVDYYVDTDKEQVERLAATVTDVMVSVSINSQVAGSTTSVNLLSHVARAAGISSLMQEEKISILIAPFYQPGNTIFPMPDPTPVAPWMIYAALGGAALLLVLLIVFVVLGRRRRKRKKQARELEELLNRRSVADGASMAAAASAGGANIMTVRTERSMELRQDIRQFAEENPEIAAQMLKAWLRGGDTQNG